MSETLALRNEYRVQMWTGILDECSESGLTNKEFCRQRGISEKSYYYRLHKLRSQIAEATTPKLVELDETGITDGTLQIVYRGAEMKLPAGVDINAVAAVLRSLQAL